MCFERDLLPLLKTIWMLKQHNIEKLCVKVPHTIVHVVSVASHDSICPLIE